MRDIENNPPEITIRNKGWLPFSLEVKRKNWQKESKVQFQIVLLFFSERNSTESRVKETSEKKRKTMGKVVKKGMGVGMGNVPSQKESRFFFVCFKHLKETEKYVKQILSKSLFFSALSQHVHLTSRVKTTIPSLLTMWCGGKHDSQPAQW